MRRAARLAAALILAAAAAPAQEPQRLSLTHDGQTRRFLLDAAPGLRDAPLMIALHGGIGGAEILRRRGGVGLHRRGWAVAWPSALDEWNDGRRDRDGAPYQTADDVGFLRALVDRLAASGTVDPGRVYVVGPSLGGTMALRLLCEAPELVAGVAVAIAAAPEGLDCPPGPPRPTLLLHGDADPIMPPEGGPIGGDLVIARDRGRVRPVAETAAALAARNRCGPAIETALPDRDPDDGSTVLRRDYAGCAAPLTHYVVRGGGHTWPGSRPLRLGAALLGPTNRDISATAEIEAFFAALAAD